METVLGTARFFVEIKNLSFSIVDYELFSDGLETAAPNWNKGTPLERAIQEVGSVEHAFEDAFAGALRELKTTYPNHNFNGSVFEIIGDVSMTSDGLCLLDTEYNLLTADQTSVIRDIAAALEAEGYDHLSKTEIIRQ